MNTDYLMELQSKTMDRISQICAKCPKQDQCTKTECANYQDIESEVITEL